MQQRASELVAEKAAVGARAIVEPGEMLVVDPGTITGALPGC